MADSYWYTLYIFSEYHYKLSGLNGVANQEIAICTIGTLQTLNSVHITGTFSTEILHRAHF